MSHRQPLPVPTDLDLGTGISSPTLCRAEDHPALLRPQYAFLADLIATKDSRIKAVVDPIDSRIKVERSASVDGTSLLRDVLPRCLRGRNKFNLHDPCRGNDCPVCLPLEARRLSGALALGRPDLLLTITSLPIQWTAIRDHLNRVIDTLRGGGRPYVWAYNVEPNSDGRAAHAHAWVRGPKVPLEVLSLASVRGGVGEIHQERTYTRGQALGYTFKEIGRTPNMPLAEALAQQATYLSLNGGRLVHNSHGFWLDPVGVPTTLRRVKASGGRVPFARTSRRAA